MLFFANLDHCIGFEGKRQFYRRKMAKIAEKWQKIAENCDQNIDPCTTFVCFFLPLFHKWTDPLSIEIYVTSAKNRQLRKAD
jgi:hypothetical protein